MKMRKTFLIKRLRALGDVVIDKALDRGWKPNFDPDRIVVEYLHEFDHSELVDRIMTLYSELGRKSEEIIKGAIIDLAMKFLDKFDVKLKGEGMSFEEIFDEQSGFKKVHIDRIDFTLTKRYGFDKLRVQQFLSWMLIEGKLTPEHLI